MRGRRLVSAVAGVSVLAGYLLVAYLAVRLLTLLWLAPPDPLATVAAVVVGALVLGYLSYRFGTYRLERSLRAVELTPARAPGYYRCLEALAGEMNVPVPRVLVARLPAPNAFTVGGGNGTLVFDERLFGLLDPDEMDALLAHELAHLEGRDALLQSLAYSLAQVLVVLVGLLVLPVVLLAGGLARGWALLIGRPERWQQSPLGRLQTRSLQALGALGFLATLALLAHSRRREYAADRRAATVTDPLALARALRTLQRAADPDRGLLTPLLIHGDDENPLSRLLSTHPPMDERIDRLMAMGGTR
ncbi:MAG: M48 family metallopeptidase [Haloarculaceae archaeon]